MADNTVLNTGAGGDTIGTDDVAGIKYQVVKQAYGADGAMTRVDATNPLPTSVPDGKNVVEGLTTDAAVVGDVAGTISGKLRQLVKILTAIFVSGDRVNVNVIQSVPTSLGQIGVQHFNDNLNNFAVTGAGGQATFDSTNNAGGSCVVAITGTWVGTLSFLGSLAEGTTTAVPAVNLADGSVVYSITANGKFAVMLAGLTQLVVRFTAWTSGTATVYVNQPAIGHAAVVLANPLPTGSNVIGQVTANAGTNLNTAALALEAGNLASIKTDVDKIPADPAREGGNLASIKTDVDKIPADPAREGGVLAKDASLTTVNTNLTTIDTDIKATQPRDVTDRSARLLGHVTVDSTPATDVTDRAARLLGIINLLEDALLYGATADATVKPGDSRNSAVRVSNLPDRRIQEEMEIVSLNTMYRAMTSRQYDRFSSMDRRGLTTQRGNAR